MNGFSVRSRFGAQENRLTLALAAERAAGHMLLDLTSGNPTELRLSPAFDELATLLAPNRFAPNRLAIYQPDSFGLLSARSAIVDELSARGFVLEAEQVMLTASTSEAYGYLFKLLCDPGDSVLVPAPSYPLFDVLAQLEQVRLVPYRLAYDGEWHLDTASLEAARDARCKAIVVVHPNNPTGSFLKHSELTRIAALGLPIISDEVFADYALRTGQNEARPRAGERIQEARPRAGERINEDGRVGSVLELGDSVPVLRLSGLSKACALPQLKLAWTTITGPRAWVKEARTRLEHIADTYLSPATPVQLALPTLLTTAAATQRKIRARLLDNHMTLTRALTNSAASLLHVEGGWYGIVRLPSLMSDEDWALCLLERDGVLTQPGYYYDLPGAYLVLSLLSDPVQLHEGAYRLAARVAALSR